MINQLQYQQINSDTKENSSKIFNNLATEVARNQNASGEICRQKEFDCNLRGLEVNNSPPTIT